MRQSALFNLLLTYIFFMPLFSVTIPGVFVGFAISPARATAVLISVFAYMNICLKKRYLQQFFKRDRYDNFFVYLLVLYFIFEIFFYYFQLVTDQTVLFANNDFFFRSWRGRSIGQFISDITYGIIPFVLIKKYAKDDLRREKIEKILVFVTLFLLLYGIFQEICVLMGLPVTGRDIYEGVIPYGTIGGIRILRFYSLGGEPRNYGGFIVGAIFFYCYYTCIRNFKQKIILLLLILSFLLTFSTTSFITFGFIFLIILWDLMRIVGKKHVMKYLSVSLVFFVFLSYSNLYLVFGEKTIYYYENFSKYYESLKMGGDLVIPYVVSAQSDWVSTAQYLMNLGDLEPAKIIFGHGYGNYSTGIADTVKQYYARDMANEDFITDAGFYAMRILIECGVLGLWIFIMMYIYTLKLNRKLLSYYKSMNNKSGYKKTLFLRFAFIAFFISNAISISHYHFIVMGIIIGKLNNLVDLKNSELKMKEI